VTTRVTLLLSFTHGYTYFYIRTSDKELAKRKKAKSEACNIFDSIIYMYNDVFDTFNILLLSQVIMTLQVISKDRKLFIICILGIT
jgi:hypothetical protein